MLPLIKRSRKVIQDIEQNQSFPSPYTCYSFNFRDSESLFFIRINRRDTWCSVRHRRTRLLYVGSSCLRIASTIIGHKLPLVASKRERRRLNRHNLQYTDLMGCALDSSLLWQGLKISRALAFVLCHRSYQIKFSLRWGVSRVSLAGNRMISATIPPLRLLNLLDRRRRPTFPESRYKVSDKIE